MGNDATPFAAVVGMERAKEALAALAVDRGLKGALIAAGPGRGKSLLARSFRSLLGTAEEVPIVEVPLGVTEDRLLGGIDLERTLQSGAPRLIGGLLARADQGFLVVNDINLLDDRSSCSIAQALASGTVRLEREGMSATLPSDFALIGTYDPAEGEVSPSLCDAVGLSVEAEGLTSEDRHEVLHRISLADRDLLGAFSQSEADTARLRAAITEARRLLPDVALGTADLIQLSEAAAALGVEGHRADIFAARMARTWAALHGRAAVEEEDLAAAVRLVILPRARVIPAPPEASSRPHSESRPPQESRGDDAPPPHMGDLLTNTLDGEVPVQLLDTLLANRPSKRMTSESRRRSVDAARAKGNRGHFVRPVTAKPPGARIALEATLRAAAQRGMPGIGGTSRLRVEKSDLRFQQRKRKAGILIVFALDASGSMAMNRISQAKGAILRLLREAYLKRDKVALVSFRGDRADVLLSPTRSVELARRALDALPAGGGTPLAKGLEAALKLARNSCVNDPRQTILVLLTDGKPNVGTCGTCNREAMWSEVGVISSALREQGVAALVIDTQQWAVSRGDGERLAGLLGARYLWLPRPNGDTVYNAVAEAAEQVRR